MKKRIEKLLDEQKGLIELKDALSLGMTKPSFYAYAQKNDLTKIGHGIYASEDAWVDPFYLIHLRCKQAVFSHETALFFHEMTDREPVNYSVTVKRGYNPSRLKKEGIMVHTAKEELLTLGLVQRKTSFGNLVPVYDIERTICDIVRNRNNMEIQLFQDALKSYARRKDKNLRRLIQYAKVFRLENVLKPYLEVLL